MIKTKEEIQQELDNLFNGNITYLDEREQFLTKKDKLLFSCSIHGEFRRVWYATRTSKWGCPICGKQLGYENSKKVWEYKYGVGGPLANKGCREKGKATRNLLDMVMHTITTDHSLAKQIQKDMGYHILCKVLKLEINP